MANDVQSQIQELEGRIQSLRSTQLSELQQKLREARLTVADLENQIAQITGKKAAPTEEGRRTRTSSGEVRSRILKVLSTAPQGLSQKEISDQTALNYNTVVLYLKNHGKDFKSTGALRAKRFFLK